MIKDVELLHKRFDELETGYLAGTDKPRVGVMCLRVPVELVEACGAIPLRISSDTGIEPNGSFGLRNDACSFCRSIPGLLNLDRYKNLSAIIGGACCDQMRRTMDILHMNLSIPIILYGAPRTWGTNENYFIGEMKRAFDELQNATDSHLREDSLPELISHRNRLRERMKTVRDEGLFPARLLRCIAASPMSAAMITDFLESNPQTEQNNKRNRLALVGSIPSGKELDIIEETGGYVVADLTCLGDRVFRLMDKKYDNPIRTLYHHYIENNLCPHRRPYDKLIEYASEIIKSRKVEGIVYRYVKYCHPFGLSAQRFRSELNLPFLELDDDLTLQATGSFRTRIGAFIEMLEARARRRDKLHD